MKYLDLHLKENLIRQTSFLRKNTSQKPAFFSVKTDLEQFNPFPDSNKVLRKIIKFSKTFSRPKQKLTCWKHGATWFQQLTTKCVRKKNWKFQFHEERCKYLWTLGWKNFGGALSFSCVAKAVYLKNSDKMLMGILSKIAKVNFFIQCTHSKILTF